MNELWVRENGRKLVGKGGMQAPIYRLQNRVTGKNFPIKDTESEILLFKESSQSTDSYSPDSSSSDGFTYSQSEDLEHIDPIAELVMLGNANAVMVNEENRSERSSGNSEESANYETIGEPVNLHNFDPSETSGFRSFSDVDILFSEASYDDVARVNLELFHAMHKFKERTADHQWEMSTREKLRALNIQEFINSQNPAILADQNPIGNNRSKNSQPCGNYSTSFNRSCFRMCCSFCYGTYVTFARLSGNPILSKDDSGPWSDHQCKTNGIVSCPVLRRNKCTVCGATGDYAHTSKYHHEHPEFCT
uniref:Nanos-type domain-containing protein n=1 Tax=Caenorhabditis japonica TaxID=281687 RepID=A0A8R1E0Y4_CAEJA